MSVFSRYHDFMTANAVGNDDNGFLAKVFYAQMSESERSVSAKESDYYWEESSKGKSDKEISEDIERLEKSGYFGIL